MNKFFLIIAFTLLYSCEAPIARTKVNIKDVKIEKESEYIWYIKGTVKNYGSRNIKGYIKVEHLNNNLDIIGNSKARINDGEYFSPQQSVSFKIAKDPKKLINVVDFNVKFIEK